MAANVNIDLLFEYNSNIDKFDIDRGLCSSVKPAFMTHIFFKCTQKEVL